MRGRHGGEEFAVLLPGVSAEGAFELAEKIAKNSPCGAISSATVRRSIRPSASASPASSRKPRVMRAILCVTRTRRRIRASATGETA
jgi:GGDEF domain-containing protein